MNNRQTFQFRLRRVLRASILVPFFAAIYFLVLCLRFEGDLAVSHLENVMLTMLAVAFTKTFVFAWYRVDQGWTRYVTFHDLVVLVKATTVGSFLLVFGKYLASSSVTVPRSVLLMDWAMTIVLFGGLRCLGRLLDERRNPHILSLDSIPVFIVGANDSGEALLRAIRRNHRLPYRVLGFITEHGADVGSILSGVPVLGTLRDTCDLARSHGVTEVLITSGELSGQKVRRLVELGQQSGVYVKVLPSYEQLLRGTVDPRPRTVSIEDLLRREPVRLDLAELHRWIDDQVLLVTGSSGSIGSEICRQLVTFHPRRLVLVDRAENGQFFLERELRDLAPNLEISVCIADVNDVGRMDQILAEHHPDIIFHAAAYKHVPLMESNPGEAVKNIVLATQKLADLAVAHQVSSFVMISTDKAVNPTSVMGACKRVAELYVQSLAPDAVCRFVTVRFGNVLDSAGSVVPVFREQIERGGPVTVTHPEMRRFFMTIPEASQLVIQAGAMGKGGEVFVLDMGQPVRIVDLAEDMIRLSGLRVDEDIEIKFVGMRPGEKLYEELHVEGEKHIATSHPKILVAESEQPCPVTLREAVQRFHDIQHASPEDIQRQLKELIPEFRGGAITPVARCAVASGSVQTANLPADRSPKTSALQIATNPAARSALRRLMQHDTTELATSDTLSFRVPRAAADESSQEEDDKQLRRAA